MLILDSFIVHEELSIVFKVYTKLEHHVLSI